MFRGVITRPPNIRFFAGAPRHSASFAAPPRGRPIFGSFAGALCCTFLFRGAVLRPPHSVLCRRATQPLLCRDAAYASAPLWFRGAVGVLAPLRRRRSRLRFPLNDATRSSENRALLGVLPLSLHGVPLGIPSLFPQGVTLNRASPGTSPRTLSVAPGRSASLAIGRRSILGLSLGGAPLVVLPLPSWVDVWRLAPLPARCLCGRRWCLRLSLS